ncbi:MAG: hypothetical protein N2C12_07115, partial [Planctomycetales bacterium]
KIRRSAPYLLPLAALFAVSSYELLFSRTPYEYHQGYIACLTAIAGIYWLQLHRVEYLASFMACMLASGATQLRRLYQLFSGTSLEHGLRWLGFGILALLLAALISFAKGGAFRRSWIGLKRINRQFDNRSGSQENRTKTSPP